MRINPFLNLKSSAAGGEGVVAIAAKGSGSVAEAGVFPMQKFCLIIIENYDFIFSSSLDLQLDEIALSSDVIPGMDGEVVWR